MTEIDAELRALHSEAEALAGGPEDIERRARAYVALYRQSGGNHIFPLLAAHGALWGRDYFHRNLAAARWATRAIDLAGGDGAARLAQVEALTDAFLDIHRRVFIGACFSWRLTARPDLAEAVPAHLPADLAESLYRLHAARRSGVSLAPNERFALYERFLHWEQVALIGPAATAAFAELDWRLARYLGLRPRVAFSYFRRPLAFRDFADTAERLDKARAAYREGEALGWIQVEAALARYAPSAPGERRTPARFAPLPC